MAAKEEAELELADGVVTPTLHEVRRRQTVDCAGYDGHWTGQRLRRPACGTVVQDQVRAQHRQEHSQKVCIAQQGSGLELHVAQPADHAIVVKGRLQSTVEGKMRSDPA